MFQLTGKIKVKGAEQVVSEKFKKREFVITDESSQYPQFISFQLANAKTTEIEPFNVGDTVKVFFNLRGREWQSPQGEIKYFNSLDCWKVEAVNAGAPTSTPQYNQAPQANMSTPSAAPIMSGSMADDDLPF